MNSIRQIEVIYDNRPVGRMALLKDGLCAFEYSNEWLNSGFQSLHLSCHCAKRCSLPNHVRLKAASGSLTIACRMNGGSADGLEA